MAGDLEELGGQALPVQVDVASWASVQAMAQRAVERFGGVDGLVNNAAVFSTIPISRVGFELIDEAEWDLVTVNVKGVWNCCNAVVPAMRVRGGGSIVNISSASILHAGGEQMHYVASKAAVMGISRVLARGSSDNMQVNSVAPGNTLSEDDPTPEVVALREAAIARSLKRVQTPADLVGTVAFPLSDDAAFIAARCWWSTAARTCMTQLDQRLWSGRWSDGMVPEVIRKFFGAYRNAFISFDGASVAAAYHAPSIMARRDSYVLWATEAGGVVPVVVLALPQRHSGYGAEQAVGQQPGRRSPRLQALSLTSYSSVSGPVLVWDSTDRVLAASGTTLAQDGRQQRPSLVYRLELAETVGRGVIPHFIERGHSESFTCL